MNKKFEKFDKNVIDFFREYDSKISRGALFIIFFWFGILKPMGLSPAAELVVALLQETFLSPIPPNIFLIGFGIFEVLIAIVVIIPKLERVTFALLGIHLLTTILPLFLLPEVTWYQPFVPTLIGQYIIKNSALIALGVMLFARIVPMTKTHSILSEER